jgi:carboxyl-terminal processing protease
MVGLLKLDLASDYTLALAIGFNAQAVRDNQNRRLFLKWMLFFAKALGACFSGIPKENLLVVKQTLPVFLALITLIFSGSKVFSQAPAVSAVTSVGNRTVSHGTSVKPVTVEAVKQDVTDALSVIEGNYVGGASLNYNDVVKESVVGMLHTLDPHSNYFDAKENEQFRAEQNSQYYGIGATIGDLSDAKGNVIATYIKATFKGAPANEVGLRYGDKIVEVNGTSMLGKPFTEVRGFLRGPLGSKAVVVVEHADTGKRQTVEITRGAVSQPSISEAYMIRPGVGYLNLNGGFNSTTWSEFVADMRMLKAQGMQQLILDLRNNPGGLVMQAYNIANAFLSAGQVVMTQKGRMEGVNETLVANNRYPDRSPLVVLVNRNSASASEILAGALQDHDRALIVGENSFGKGLVQGPIQNESPFKEMGSMLLLTIAKYQTPSGRAIQRDYSNGELYSDMYEGGSLRDENIDLDKPKGDASRTDTGRAVYGGAGITQDVIVKPKTISIERARLQQKLVSPIFAYALELVNGRVKGYESYRVDRPITFAYDIKATDFPVTPALYQNFKDFAAAKYHVPAAQLDAEKEFVERILRSELITAAYGAQSSYQVYNDYDEQLLKAIDTLPQARQLALQSERVKMGVSRKGNSAN